MNQFILSCCSTVDVTKKFISDRDISTISMHYTIAGKSLDDDFGETIPLPDFYQAMRDGAETKTSQINADEFTEYFKRLMSDGKDVLHVTLSSGISGTYNSARLAAEDVKKLYPDQKLYVVDSLGGSSGYGLIMDKLYELKQKGFTIDELYQWIETHKLEVHHWFFSTDLTYFVRGGRISKVSGWFGTLLKICPLLDVNKEGKIVPRNKIRGKKSVIRAIVQKMEECAQNNNDYCEKCFISHSDCYADAKEVADLIEEKFPKLKSKVEIFMVGTTIGCHTGPGSVAIFFWGDKRGD